MNDIDELLRSDAERWQARLRPVPDLDEQLRVALSRARRSRHLLPPMLAAALVVAIAATVVAIRLVGNGSSQPSSRRDLAQITGVVWKDPNSFGTVVYTNTTMRLFDGCSNELAYLRIEHGALVQGRRIGPFSTCTGTPILPGPQGDEIRAQQKRLAHFYAIVAGPASWSRSADILTLHTPGKGTLHLTTDKTRAPMLVGTEWKLAYYSGTDSDEHPAPKPVGFVVRGDGRFTAGLNCGGLVGTAQVSEQTIRLSKLGSSSCAGGLDPASKVIFDVITAREATYAIRGTQLIIQGANGRLLIYQS